MARKAAKGAGMIRKDVADEEISPELLDELAERASALGDEGDSDDADDEGDDEADAIIDADDDDDDLDDDDGEDDGAGLSGDDSQDVGGTFDQEPADDDSDDADGDDDLEDEDEDDDADDDDADDDDDQDQDEGEDPDTDDEDEDEEVSKDMSVDEPDLVDEDEVEATKPEEGDGKKKNEQEATKKSAELAADLRRAIDAMVRHGDKHDPSMRKEALMAKELNGNGLSPAERGELAKMLIGGSRVSKLQKAVYAAQAPSDALKKSMVSNEAMGLVYDNVTKSLLVQAEHLENSCAGLESTQFLMAKALTKVGETVAKMADEQTRLRGQLARLNRAPVAAPRSVGVDWARKSLAGARVPDGVPEAKAAGHKRLAKASPSRIDEALQALCKAADPKSEMGRAYASARDAIAIHRPLMPSIAAKVDEYLADH